MRMKERNGGRAVASRALACTAMVALLNSCAAPGVAPTREPAPSDVVSVGYGVQSRKDVTGSISSVAVDDVSRSAAAGIEDLLEGRVAGLQVIHLPGGRFTVRIRGVGTLGNSEPLLVVDDVPVMTGSLGSGLASIAPLDVLRIDVLKGAAAGVYGMRGANGVILVTTRRGR